MNPETFTPTIVLVHDAFEEASIWRAHRPQLKTK
jgi:hypothetical protein